MIVNPFHRTPGDWTCRSADGRTFADSEDRHGDWCHALFETDAESVPNSSAIVVRSTERVIAIAVNADPGPLTSRPSEELVANAFVIAAASAMFGACAAFAKARAGCSHLGRCDCLDAAGDLILAALEKAKGGAA